MGLGELKVGQLVYSKMGRDRNRLFLIWKIEQNSSFVYLVDGDLRKIERPKKKNIKHIQPTNKIASDIVDKLNQNQTVNNAEIRQAIKRLIQTDQEDSVSDRQGGKDS
ncbi:KOW domain-containing RNA-binding protein [Calderihabitans maritimus]|uniref:RNA-binding protein n=1 Tax=Calderihabitans maritimus TaxID=1246530 RepID=A0A1Z5HNC8_9FIRM|nr:KOW domain-containing RNA-binding protein [Calderihabitans maritimus]GAW90887.1 hypothetical protein Moth_2437 [Calderihabitans maritimus]